MDKHCYLCWQRRLLNIQIRAKKLGAKNGDRGARRRSLLSNAVEIKTERRKKDERSKFYRIYLR